MDASLEQIIEKARQATDRCYSPYSKLRIAAVLEDDAGGFHLGVNVENSSCGLTICAERAAVFSAVASGHTRFGRILIYSRDIEPLPCGACRQVLSEFCDDDFQVITATDDTVRHYTLAELLPHGFGQNRT